MDRLSIKPLLQAISDIYFLVVCYSLFLTCALVVGTGYCADLLYRIEPPPQDQ